MTCKALATFVPDEVKRGQTLPETMKCMSEPATALGRSPVELTS